MTNIIGGAVSVVRKATDISSKIQAAAAGGVTAGSVTAVLAAINPQWDPPVWLVGLITLLGALVVGYVKKDTIKVSTIGRDGTVVENVELDTAEIPDLEMPDWLRAQIAAQDSVGEDETEQPAGPDDDEPKHLARAGE